MEYAKKSTGIIVGVDELDGALLRECRSLKAVVKFGVGTDNIDLKQLRHVESGWAAVSAPIQCGG